MNKKTAFVEAGYFGIERLPCFVDLLSASPVFLDLGSFQRQDESLVLIPWAYNESQDRVALMQTLKRIRIHLLHIPTGNDPFCLGSHINENLGRRDANDNSFSDFSPSRGVVATSVLTEEVLHRVFSFFFSDPLFLSIEPAIVMLFHTFPLVRSSFVTSFIVIELSSVDKRS